MNQTTDFCYTALVAPKTLKVANILARDGGITHMTALHYGIGSVTKEITRLRDNLKYGYRIKTVKRKDADGNMYTRWTLSKAF